MRKRLPVILTALILTALNIVEARENDNVIWLIEPQFDHANNFSEGLASIKKDKYGYINRDGKTVINEDFGAAHDFNGGLAKVNITGKGWSFINKEGKLITEPRDENRDDFGDGVVKVFKKSEGNVYINKEGRIMFKCREEFFYNYFHDGMSLIYVKDKGYGYINTDGRVIVEPHLESANWFYNSMARVKKNGKWGYIDKEGSFVIEPRFDFAHDFSDGLALVKNNGMYGYIDKKGIPVIDYQYEEADYFYEGLAPVKKGGKWFFINRQGKVTIKPRNDYDQLYSFNEGLALVWKDGKGNGLINKQGTEVLKPGNQSIESFSEGMARLEINREWGYINKQGKIVIRPQYDDACDFKEGLAAVKKDGRWGFINKQGKFIIEPQFDELGYSKKSGSSTHNFSEGFTAVKKEGKWGFIKNPLNASKQEESFSQSGQLIGDVKSVSGREITVGGKDIAEKVMMGDKLCLFSNDKIIILRATFPMQTITKCEVISGNLNDIKTGIKVYKYRKFRDEQKQK